MDALPAPCGRALCGGLTPHPGYVHQSYFEHIPAVGRESMTQCGWGLADPSVCLGHTQGHHVPWEGSDLILLDPQTLVAASGLEEGHTTRAAPL